MKETAILLVRVSTNTQDYNAQIEDLQKYAKSFGFSKFKIIETKESGLLDLQHKSGTNELFDFVKKNPNYKTVFTTEISRLGRRQSVLHIIKEWFITNKVQLHVKDIKYTLFDDDTVSANGEMMFTLYGMFAENEIKQRVERFARKKRELMESGISISGKLLFGYKRKLLESEKNTLEADSINAKYVKQIFNWYLKGIHYSQPNPSIKKITLECIKRGYPQYTHSKRNINKLLKEEAYTGFKTTNNKRKNPKFGLKSDEPQYLISSNNIKYPPIIDKKLFNAVQTKLKTNVVNADKDTKHITLLSKLINCTACNRKLSANYRPNKRSSYRCTSRTDANPCPNSKSFSMQLLDNTVWSLIRNNQYLLKYKMNELNPNVDKINLNNQLQNVLSKLNQLNEEKDALAASVIGFQKLKNLNVKDFITAQTRKLEKYDKECGKLLQEKLRLESLLLIMNDENESDVPTETLEVIEQSKEHLYKYIHSLIESIDILHTSVQHTILKVKMIDLVTLYHFDNLGRQYINKMNVIEVIGIDKTVTNSIKLITPKIRIVDGQKDTSIKIETATGKLMQFFKKGKIPNEKLIPYHKLII